ncbi:class F sortase [Streptomyces sp. NPDC048751]|uniref:class F sortase n=1 Tax=Streptomyces sp. NPDC048751 TaxID=3365591 RepID=UPI003723EA4B
MPGAQHPRPAAPAANPNPTPPGAQPTTPAAPAAQNPHPAPPAIPRRPPAKPRPRPLPRSRATVLLIRYLSLKAPIMDLRLDRQRRLPAPPDGKANFVGWNADGPTPGEKGTAVAVGHLDTDTGPAVFAGLTEVKRGVLVEVRRADGRTAVYTVDAVRKYEKANFPNKEVYGPRGRPELRLITCGGDYNRRTGYSGNLVVFAHLKEIHEPDKHSRAH